MPVLLAISVLTLDEAFYFHLEWIQYHVEVLETMTFIYRCAQSLGTVFFYLIPIGLYWFFVDKKKMPFYGFGVKKFKVKPYLIMLACMFPLLLAASFRDDFLQNYPIYYNNGFNQLTFIPQWLAIPLFELCYGLNFIMVEFLFRGFMVIALAETIGINAILPMATVYCVFHFGKPWGETISSFFGGTILGVVTYNSRSIYGGIMVHLGIAFMMELLAFLQKCSF
ncbi:MAG: CPBP family intramembrane metalloprotease [Sphingobacteriales bacterium]|nr:CPBP family intramembrane metalloprotease [Sphingobacteriales bacterium]